MLGLALATAGGLAGCASGGDATGPTTASGPPTRTTPTPEAPTMTDARTLLVYYSRAGENYWYGSRRTLTTGNTERVARIIVDSVDCDTFGIEAGDPYPTGYDATVARNVDEQQDDARPAVAAALPDVSGYGTVLLGSPIWNVRPPMIMSTFLDGVDLGGKVLRPFVTYAVSGLGRTADVYGALVPGARVTRGLAVRGEEAEGSEDAVRAWLAGST